MSVKAEQMSLSDLDIWYGKTSQEPCPQTREKTSGASSKKLSGSSKKMPIYLDLRRGGGLIQDVSWEMGGPLLGEYTMHSFGEYPKEENVSLLSQILVEEAHPKYSLSAKACQGILNRASRRGKQLPEILRQALENQAKVSLTDGITEPGMTTESMVGILHVIKGAYVCLKYEAMIFDARGNGGGAISPTITGDHQNRVTDYTAIVLAIHEADGQNVTMMEETA